MFKPISISGYASVSSLGLTKKNIIKAYQSDKHFLSQKMLNNKKRWLAKLSREDEDLIKDLRDSYKHYNNLDNTVLYGIYTARKSIKNAQWETNKDFGVNMSSSRGATHLFEKYHGQYLEEKKTTVSCSPTTTLGNISSLGSSGFAK